MVLLNQPTLWKVNLFSAYHIIASSILVSEMKIKVIQLQVALGCKRPFSPPPYKHICLFILQDLCKRIWISSGSCWHSTTAGCTRWQDFHSTWQGRPSISPTQSTFAWWWVHYQPPWLQWHHIRSVVLPVVFENHSRDFLAKSGISQI